MSLKIINTGFYDTSIYEPIDMINAISVHSISLFRGFFAGFSGLLGGKQSIMEEKYIDLRKDVMNEIYKKGIAMNADLIIGLDIQVSEILNEFMIFVATATALKLKKKPNNKNKNKNKITP